MSTVKTNNVQLGQSVTATNNFTWYQPASPDGTVRLGNGNSGSVTDLVTLTSAGNLGIGTSSPAQKLDVVGYATITNATAGLSGTAKGTIRLYDSSSMASGVGAGVAFLGQATTGSSAYTTAGSIQSYKVNGTSGDDGFGLQFTTRSNGNGCATVMTLDASGNLGLGVTPSAWGSLLKAIQIGSGGAFIGSYNNANIYFGSNQYWDGTNWRYTTSAYTGQFLFDNATGKYIWNTAASGTAGNAISFTQAMTLDASGRLLVGTTSQNGFFTVDSAATNTNMASFAASNTSGPNYVLSLQSYANAANTGAFIRAFVSTSTLCFNVAGNGNVTNTNNSYGAISDRSLKENIVDATPKLVDLLKVKIRNFNLIGDSTKQIGVVAQELEEVFPAMVEEDKDGIKSVKYSVFPSMLIKAIQELSAEIETLKQKVNA